MSRTTPELVEHLFRHSSGRVLAGLTRRFGLRHLELAEDAVQEALIKALRLWPYRGVPDRPEAWLRRVASNQMLDALRRDDRLRDFNSDLDASEVVAPDPDGDLLAMMLLCCHPAISPDAQVALTLKLVAGFGVPEIARAFLAKEATIGQKLSRARRTLRENDAAFEDTLSDARIDAVAAALYLVFNEGYAMSSGDAHISVELCKEAIRLTRLLCERLGRERPDIDALLALMMLQAARLPARVDRDGEIMTLEEQDRSLWDRGMLAAGVDALNRSARGDRLTAFHLQAGIASFHSLAPDWASTDWAAILEQYDELLRISDSPIAALNRCVAVAMAVGPRAGLNEVERVVQAGELGDYALLHATAGELAWRCGERDRAIVSFNRARQLVTTAPERRLIERKIARAGAISKLVANSP